MRAWNQCTVHENVSRPLLTFPILSWFTRLPNDTFSDVPFLYLCCFLVGSGGLHAWLVYGLSGLSFVHLIAPCQERHQATLRDPDNKSMKRTQWLLHALAALTPLTRDCKETRKNAPMVNTMMVVKMIRMITTTMKMIMMMTMTTVVTITMMMMMMMMVKKKKKKMMMMMMMLMMTVTMMTTTMMVKDVYYIYIYCLPNAHDGGRLTLSLETKFDDHA